MASLAEIVARARTIAAGRGDGHKSPVLDSTMTAEALVPHAIRYCLKKASHEEIENTTADHDIEIDADGEGTLPDGVMRRFMDESYLPDLPRSAYVPYADFNRHRFDELLCYFTTKNGAFFSNCSLNHGTLDRTIYDVTKNENSDEVTMDGGIAATGTLTVNESNAKARGSLIVGPAAAKATGYWDFHGAVATGNIRVFGRIVEGETVRVNGVLFTFSNQATADTPSTTLPFTSNAATNAAILCDALNASTDAALSVATYARLSTVINITYDTVGSAGNTFKLADSVLPSTIATSERSSLPGAPVAGSIVASGPKLTGGEDGVEEGETIDVNGLTFTFSNQSIGDEVVAFTGILATDAAAFAAALNASVNVLISVATYTASGGRVSIQYDTFGTAGNGFDIASSSDNHVTASGSTLTGGQTGIVEAETINVNGTTFNFRNLFASTEDVSFGPSAENNAAALAAVLNASVVAGVAAATYTAEGPIVHIQFDTAGAGGNSFDINNSSGSGVVASGDTLEGGGAGGVSTGTTLTVNGVDFIFTSELGPFHINFADAAEITAGYIAAKLNSLTTNTSLNVATYSSDGAVVTITYRERGTDGNAFTIENSNDDTIIASSSTLVGGTDGNPAEFVALDDTGRRIVIVEGANDTEVVNAIIEEVVNADTARVRAYHEGDFTTDVPLGDARIYERRLELVRTIASVDKSPATNIVVAATGTGGGTDTDIGYLIEVDEGVGEQQETGEVAIRAIIIDVIDEDTFLIAGYHLTEIGEREARIYRILDPVITLNAPTVPEMPASADTDIGLSARMTEDVILTVAGALTGEIPVGVLLGGEEAKEQ